MDILGFSVAAGMLAAVNPCGFAMLPAYLTMVVTGSVARALTATLLMASGFLVVFGTFGLAVSAIGSAIQYLPAVTVLIGLAIAVVGGLMLAGRDFPRSGAPSNLRSIFGYGLAYAVVSLSCTIGPFLAVTSTTFRVGSILAGFAAYLAYAMGMALIVGVLAVSAALARSVTTARIRQIPPYVNLIGGVILVLSGLYVAYYGVYELLLYHADRSARDPIVDGIGRLQTVLSGWVNGLPPAVAVAVLAVLVGVGWVGTRMARSGRRD